MCFVIMCNVCSVYEDDAFVVYVLTIQQTLM